MICTRCSREIPDDAVLCCYCGRVYRRKPPSRVHQRANGTGTAYKSGKGWMAEVTIGWVVDKNGKRHRRRLRKSGFKTRTDALEYTAELLSPSVKKKAPQLSAYWTIYSGGEMEKLSDSKRTAYKIAWDKLKSLELRPIDTLTVADLRRVVGEKTTTYYPARDMKVLLSHLFTLGAADGWCSRDLPSFIILPEKNETAREPFTEEEQKRLWKAYESGCSDAAIPLIMIYTGMMTGEMRRLTVAMIDFENRRIIGVGLKTEVRKASPVYIPNDIMPVIADVISRLPAITSPAPASPDSVTTVGPSSESGASAPDGSAENSADPIPDNRRLWSCNEEDFYARYYAALETAGVRRLTPYSCRHTTATALAISENIAPETVRKVMRWSTTAMLSRYAHPNDADALAAADTLKRKTAISADSVESSDDPPRK